jgi:radical SAM superfamily enzyme YgiQ (UPF0313 family)
MAELETIREKEIYIVDDDFLLKPARIREFINALLERNLDKKFLVYGRADFIVNNPELIRDFRQAGLRTVIVGLESFDDEELSGFRKKTTASLNERAMEILNRNSVDCYAAVIISPGWDRSAFQRAGKIMRKLRIKFVNLQPLTPLKGTGIEVNPENLIVPREDFPRWDLAHVTIRPEKMSTRDFYANILRLYEKLVLNPANLFSHAGYPLHMHWRMLKGIIKVRKQYKNRIMEAGHA